MSVTIVESPRKDRHINGVGTEIGKAYRLVSTLGPGQNMNVGTVYLRTYNGCVNLQRGGLRSLDAGDKYEEVDLEIHVKEKN